MSESAAAPWRPATARYCCYSGRAAGLRSRRVRRRKVAGFGDRAVHGATTKEKPTFRCSLLIGRDAPNLNALRDPEKQKPPRQREGRSAGGRLQAPDPPPTGWVPNSKFRSAEHTSELQSRQYLVC